MLIIDRDPGRVLKTETAAIGAPAPALEVTVTV